MSAAPAGGKLTIQRIGFDGQGVCAAATPGAARAARTEKRRRDSMADPSKAMKARTHTATCVLGIGQQQRESRRWISIWCYATHAFLTASRISHRSISA